MTAINLTPRLRLAADFMESVGWTQGNERDVRGRVCLTGAIRFCAPQTGDEHLICEVMRKRGRAENWNDDDGREEAEVLGFLRTAVVTDADLAATFGPQWREVVAFVRRAASLAYDEAARLDTARYEVRYATRAAARDAAQDAVGGAAAWAAVWGPAWAAVGGAVEDAAGDAVWEPAWATARDVVVALVTRDLIGTHGYTQDHYNTLTRAWREVIGPVHPDDEGGASTARSFDD